ncbi:hypothetical protein Trydic_g9338 [Trypoxylus dichotomus]
MENENSVIYGLEFQARALTPQQSENEKIKFFIGTQSLKQTNNQIHLVEFDEENSTLKTTVFYHTLGEIWKINSSPLNASLISTCYNTITNDSTCSIRTSILTVPEESNPDQIETLEAIVSFPSKLLKVCENQTCLWDTTESEAKSILNIDLEGKNNPKFTTGKWNPHQGYNQFTTATETHLKTYDIRSGQLAWHIEGVHSQLLRDLDYNLNKQYHLATCGDDGFVKIWDFRQTSQPVYSRSDHSHWVWCVRFNPFHDQLILTASSDARVLISSAASVSSENYSDNILSEDSNASVEPKQMLSDGPLQWCEHEDSVYCAEWSPAEPWIFASLNHKRINGPENTIPYKLYTKLNVKSVKEILQEAVNNGIRGDKRKLDQHRRIFMKADVVSQAKGSAYIEIDKTKVIVSVFDPREIPNKNEYSLNGELYCEFKYAPFSCPKRRLHQQDAEEKQNSIVMKQALEPAVCRHEFPNFQVDIYALVLENDGSALSAAITCAGLALAQAGIPMFDIITSATIGVQGDLKLLDPTLHEETLCHTTVNRNTKVGKNSHGIIALALLSTHQQVTEFYQVGNMDLEDIEECTKLLTEANKIIVPLVEKCLAKHVIKGVKESNQ